MKRNLLSLLDALLPAGTLALVFLSPTQHSLEIAPRTYVSIVDPLAWLLLCAWGLRAVLRRRPPRRHLLPPWWSLAFLAAAAVSIPGAEQRLTALKDLVQYVEYLVVAWLLMADALDSPARRRRALYLLLTAAAVNTAVAAAQYLGAADTFGVRGLFGNRNVLGGFLALALPPAYALALWDTHPLRRAAAGLLVAAGVLVTVSGGTFVALLAALALMSAARGPRTFAGFAVAAVLLCLAVLPSLPRGHAGALHESMALYTADGEPTPRYPEWQAAMAMWREHPWRGVGAGNYQVQIGRYFGTLPNPVRAAEPDSQNLYLVLGSSLGAAGFAAWLGLLVSAAAQAVRRALAVPARDRALAAGAAGALLAFAVNAVWAPLLVRGIGIPLVFILWLAAGRQPAAADGKDPGGDGGAG